jgi:hypothetical protein
LVCPLRAEYYLIPFQESFTRRLLKKGGDEAMAKSKVTSKRAASAASKVLRDGRTGKASKTAAGSALSQRPSKKK